MKMFKKLMYHWTDYVKIKKIEVCFVIETDSGYEISSITQDFNIKPEIIKPYFLYTITLRDKYSDILKKRSEELLKEYRKKKIRTTQNSKWVSGTYIKKVRFYVKKGYEEKITYEEYKKIRGWE